jgi:hypothetical protein
MTTLTKTPGIKGIEFINTSIMFVHLDNDRTFIVPLNKFSDIEKLTQQQQKDFEIIDDHYLSFLAIDEIYSISDLTGL